MVINKHGSFYLRNGWGTKIIDAVNTNNMIFSPYNEQEAIDTIGLGRIMIRALRYWAVAMGLTKEIKRANGIEHFPTTEFEIINRYDKHFQKPGSLFILQRNLALNKDNATAWYWLFNEWKPQEVSREEFVEYFHSYLLVNGLKVNKAAVEKEFNCVKNTYITDKKISIKTIMDEDTLPFFSPLNLVEYGKNKSLKKKSVSLKELTSGLLIYCIARDNADQAGRQGQVTIDSIVDSKEQVGRYFNLDYSTIIDGLLEAENAGIIRLNNNFGNRLIEFVDYNYNSLFEQYYVTKR